MWAACKIVQVTTTALLVEHEAVTALSHLPVRDVGLGGATRANLILQASTATSSHANLTLCMLPCPSKMSQGIFAIHTIFCVDIDLTSTNSSAVVITH